MAQELSQAELLDFLCQAGGRVANAALLGHFKRFLRDPAAGPEELQRRRALFKGFVNSVATVAKQDGPGGGATVVVLRRRYRELVGEEPRGARERQAAPLDGPGGAAGEGLLGHRQEEQEEEEAARTCGTSTRDLRASPEPGGGRGGAPLPATPAPLGPPTQGALLRGSPKNGPVAGPPGDPPTRQGGAPKAVGAPPRECLRARVGAWVASAGGAALQSEEGAPWPSPPSSPRSRSSGPSWPLESQLGPEEWRERPLVFRSIRCQLSLQDLDEFLEQESPASEDSSSASDSCRGEGEGGFPRLPSPRGPDGCGRSPPQIGLAKAGEGLPCKPQANGLVGPPAKAGGQPPGPPSPRHPASLGHITRGSSSEDELLDKGPQRTSRQVQKPKKATLQPSPHLDAPLSLHLVPCRGPPNTTPAVERPSPDTDASPEHRSSLVPLEPREHTWMVKVAAGSWLQARALFLEDPHLATRKDFISGYTVLHWLAKHGSTQVLLDFVSGAQRAGVALDVNVKSGCGYTPLHLAAMHGHPKVIRVLVQKLQSQVHVRDSSGRKPWQYLSSSTSGEIWQLLGAPRGKTIFPAHLIPRSASPARKGKSPELPRKVTRKTSLAAYLKPQHIKWKMANKYPALQEREEYSD
ncbi:ankyrin repeat domain-containing protein SOWAHB [Sphaerodactylus townsendi]|uniref:ankyrin repeat domain-containing protein SOWAHB n=1 Tax=Sphaerodactylus townsendi TaxID=933632 RepID=UPI002026418B|nr:ankyrin repeat domain-containing protein SOWAHB [Sphaerodactylus townsendi]